ncbi:MAG: glycoside hydrolase family 43 protein [Microthrixaceae bacterium]
MNARRRRRRVGLAGVVVAALAGGALWWTSADGPGGRSDGAEPGQRPVTVGDDPRTDAPVSPGRALALGVPIYDGDFADPFMLAVDGTYYAYATSTTDATLPVIELRDGIAPTLRSVELTLPTWSTGQAQWAPAVFAVDGAYVMYFTTEVAATQRQCVSFAVADDPLGPFRDPSSEPFVCQEQLGGTIDPSIVVDAGGGPWLLYKNDGNCCELPTSLWSQRLAADGRSLVGDPHRLLTARREWEGDLIEAPSMVVDGRRHLLFYSANAWDSSRYAIGYAECESVAGPCVRREPSPWMSSEPITRGPGGQEFFAADGELWMVYAAWRRGEIGYPDGQRRLFLDVVEVRDGVPTRLGGRRTSMLVVFLAGGAVALGAAAAGWRAHARASRRAPAGTT